MTLTTSSPVLRVPERQYRGYIFDLDGTVYLGSELLPGAAELIAGLRRRGARLLFVTNNPTRNQEMYAEKLSGLGIPTRPEEIVNTVVTMTTWLAAQPCGTGVFVIGEAPLREAIAGAGIRLTDDPREIDVVVASFDYAKLQTAFDALTRPRPARLVTTNPDVYCPFPGGRGEPDAGAIVAAIEACTKVKCSVNTGKPDRIMLETAMWILGLDAGDCIMIGDRLSTDIAMAVAAGMDSALVLTGETTPEMMERIPPEEMPTYVLPDIGSLW
jgi:HAD superfamily hydrolase (TIGR01450 family)